MNELLSLVLYRHMGNVANQSNQPAKIKQQQHQQQEPQQQQQRQCQPQ
jgi:hypothetical protein